MKRFLPIIIASSLIKLALVWTGVCERSLLADDAYYYFTIARNMAHGMGPTFDGISLTNGFHPLWQFLVVPCFLPPGLWLPIHLALTITVLFDVLSCLLIVDIVRRVTLSDPAAVTACMLWSFFPWTLLGLRGMESSLSALMVLLSMRLTLKAVTSSFTTKSSVASGVALALAGLARTDNLPCLALATLGAVLSSAGRDLRRRAWRWWLWQGGVASVLVCPWFAWNWREFGMLVQVSGLVKLHTHGVFGTLPDWQDSLSGDLHVFFHRLLAPILVPMRFLLAEEFHATTLTPLMTLVVAGLFLVPISLGMNHLVRNRATRPVFAFSGVWLLMHVFLFSFLWSSYAPWYALVPMALLIILMTASISVGASPHGRLPRLMTPAFLAVAVAIYAAPLLRRAWGTTTPEKRFGARLSTAAALTPEPVIGAFNAGALGYTARSRYGIAVVNLDGLVNNRVYEALKAHRYVEYVISTVDIMFEDPKRASALISAADVRRLDDHYRLHDDHLWHRVRMDR